jgi:hypothetical protein
MTDARLSPNMTRREILERVLAAERGMRDVLEEAARVVRNPDERALYKRLAALEDCALRELVAEEARLEAAEFVRQAIEV